MAIRREGARRLDQTGEQSGFGQGYILQVFIEIGAGAFGQAGDGERTALSQIDAVGVELENLLFGKFLLQLDRDQHFDELAAKGFLRAQEESPRKLHGDGGTALLMALVGEVDPGGFHQAHEIDAVVLKKAAVLDGRDCVDDNFGDLVVLDQLAFGALLGVEERGEHLGLKLVGLQFSGGTTVDGRDGSVGDGNGGRFRAVIRLGAGHDLDRTAMETIAAERRFVLFFRITGVTQRRGDFCDSRFGADFDYLRGGENFRGAGECGTAEALFDDAVVLYIPVGKNAEHHERSGEESEQGETHNRLKPPFPRPLALAPPRRAAGIFSLIAMKRVVHHSKQSSVRNGFQS